MGITISPLGWILIIFLIVFIASINITLFVGMKKKQNKVDWVARLQDAGRTIKDPFHDENTRMQELSQQVEQLHQARHETHEKSKDNAGEIK